MSKIKYRTVIGALLGLLICSVFYFCDIGGIRTYDQLKSELPNTSKSNDHIYMVERDFITMCEKVYRDTYPVPVLKNPPSILVRAPINAQNIDMFTAALHSPQLWDSMQQNLMQNLDSNVFQGICFVIETPIPASAHDAFSLFLVHFIYKLRANGYYTLFIESPNIPKKIRKEVDMILPEDTDDISPWHPPSLALARCCKNFPKTHTYQGPIFLHSPNSRKITIRARINPITKVSVILAHSQSGIAHESLFLSDEIASCELRRAFQENGITHDSPLDMLVHIHGARANVPLKSLLHLPDQTTYPSFDDLAAWHINIKKQNDATLPIIGLSPEYPASVLMPRPGTLKFCIPNSQAMPFYFVPPNAATRKVMCLDADLTFFVRK